MKCSVFFGKKKIEMEDRQIPEIKENEILVKVMAAGICGTDVHIYNGEKGSAEVNPPVILGHEFAGKVVKVGKKVTLFREEDKVTVDPNIYCGECVSCRNGKKQLCENLRAIGVNQDGGFEQYCAVPQQQAFLLNQNVDYEEGAMAEPVACCLHGIENIEIKAGSTVCVIGGGAIGLIMIQLAKLRGAAKVVLSEPIEMRRKLALTLGADAAVDPMQGNLLEQIEEAIGTKQIDAVIECVGKTIAVEQAFSIAGKGTSILLFSVPQEDAVFELKLFDVYKKELKIYGSFINPDTHYRATQLINSKQLKLKPLITHRYNLEQTADAIKKQMQNDSVKVVVLPN